MSFEQLRKATLRVEGDSAITELVVTQRQAVADLLGIDESHLDELFFNIEQPEIAISEEELEQFFGFKNTRDEDVFAAPGTPTLAKWQRERLESIWQAQDWPADVYSGEERRPYVDPVIISEAYLRLPLDENPAFALLETRRETLNTHRQVLIASNPQQNGLADLLVSELGQPIAQLRSLYEALQASEPSEDVAPVHEAIATLHLTPAGFSFMMDIDARIENGAPIGMTSEEIDAAWVAVFDILSRAHRHALFPSWVEEENNLGLIFGPKLFWLPVEQVEPSSPWQAPAAERIDWEESLHRHSSRPFIDPNQIQASHLKIFRTVQRRRGLERRRGRPLTPLHILLQQLPPLAPYGLWVERQGWIRDRTKALQAVWQGQAITIDSFQSVMQASTLGVGLEIFEELADLENEGRDIEPRLAQLSLTTAEFRFLADIHFLAQGNALISDSKKHEVEAILVMAEKRREFAEWRLAEQADNIFLRPTLFDSQRERAPVTTSSKKRWLHDPVAFQQWLDTLQARDAQLGTLEDALEQAVDDAAGTFLPLLRNSLIKEAETPEKINSFEEKSNWLDKRLLIDMRMDSCHMTTRVSQAIETLQRFIIGVYTQEHLDPMQHFTLDAEEDYETDWPVIGAYATWRAFMLAYLYPENLLHVSPSLRESFGYLQFKRNLSSRVTPAQACAAAEAYSEVDPHSWTPEWQS